VAWANLGRALSAKKSYDDAHEAFERAVAIKHDYPDAWNGLGRVELRLGKVPAAVAAQERARKLDPKNGTFAADLCQTLFDARDPGRAAGECRAALALEPNNAYARYELGKALAPRVIARRPRPKWPGSARCPA